MSPHVPRRPRTMMEMDSYELSHNMREILVQHCPGPQPAIIGCHSRQCLIRRGLIDYAQYKGLSNRPTHTKLTEKGRELACVILGQYADAITGAKNFIKKLSAPPTIPDDREMALAKLMATEKV